MKNAQELDFELRFNYGDEFVDLLEKYKELKKINKQDINEYNEIYPIIVDIIENKNTPISFRNEMFNEIIKYNNDNGCKIFALNHIDCPKEIIIKLCENESIIVSSKAEEKLLELAKSKIINLEDYVRTPNDALLERKNNIKEDDLDMSKLNDQMDSIGSTNEVEHTSTNKNHNKR